MPTRDHKRGVILRLTLVDGVDTRLLRMRRDGRIVGRGVLRGSRGGVSTAGLPYRDEKLVFSGGRAGMARIAGTLDLRCHQQVGAFVSDGLSHFV